MHPKTLKPKPVYRNPPMDFADWYAQYPRKTARADAEKAWKRMTLPDRKLAIDALPLHIAYWRATGTEREFVPYPATWLRGRRWEDEIEMPRVEEKVTQWWATEAGVLAKGREVGCSPRPGEDITQYKSRVAEAIRKVA